MDAEAQNRTDKIPGNRKGCFAASEIPSMPRSLQRRLNNFARCQTLGAVAPKNGKNGASCRIRPLHPQTSGGFLPNSLQLSNQKFLTSTPIVIQYALTGGFTGSAEERNDVW